MDRIKFAASQINMYADRASDLLVRSREAAIQMVAACGVQGSNESVLMFFGTLKRATIDLQILRTELRKINSDSRAADYQLPTSDDI
jgi:hypothetical protein